MLAVQCKMARVALGLGIRELAELAKVAPATISRLEAGEELKPRTVEAIKHALEAAGVQFIPENGGGAGVRLREAVPRLESVRASRGDRRLRFELTYRGERYQVSMPSNILDDIDRTNHESDTAVEGAFRQHQNLILVRAAAIIDAGRATANRDVELRADDFPETK